MGSSVGVSVGVSVGSSVGVSVGVPVGSSVAKRVALFALPVVALPDLPASREVVALPAF